MEKRSRKTRERSAGGVRPAAAAEKDDGALGCPEELLQPAHVGGAGPGLDWLEGGRVGHGDALDQHVLGERDDDRSRAAAGRGVEGPRDELGDAGGIVDLGRPFGDRSEHRAIVELLEGLALAHFTCNLADEQDHRRGILARDVQPRRRVGGAGPAGDEADAGPSGRLALALPP